MNLVKFVSNLISKPRGGSPAPVTSDRGTGWFWRMLLPGTERDFESELRGRVHLNTLVALSVDYFASNFAESPLIIQKRVRDEAGNRKWEYVEHELEEAMEQPNPYYTWDVLAYGIGASWGLEGNCYILQWPDRLGRIQEFYWLPHDKVTAMDDGEDQDGSKIITHFRYEQPGGEPIDIPPEYILHLRRGIDPNDMKKGFAPIKATLREVFGDNVAATYVAAVTDNLAVPAAVLSFEGMTLDRQKQETVASSIRQAFRGDGAGRVAVLPKGAKLDKLSFSPKELAIDKLTENLTGRICAAMGFDPMVLGLPSANKTYSNKEEADDAAYSRVILPAKRAVANQMTVQLLRRWYKEQDTRVWWDFSEVAAMQDDLDALFTRAGKAFTEGWIMESEARTIAKLDSAPEHDRYVYEVYGGGMGDEANMDDEESAKKHFRERIKKKIAARNQEPDMP